MDHIAYRVGPFDISMETGRRSFLQSIVGLGIDEDQAVGPIVGISTVLVISVVSWRELSLLFNIWAELVKTGCTGERIAGRWQGWDRGQFDGVSLPFLKKGYGSGATRCFREP